MPLYVYRIGRASPTSLKSRRWKRYLSNARVQYADQLTAAILLLLSQHPLKAIGAMHSQRPAKSLLAGLLLRKRYGARRKNAKRGPRGVICGASAEWGRRLPRRRQGIIVRGSLQRTSTTKSANKRFMHRTRKGYSITSLARAGSTSGRGPSARTPPHRTARKCA